VVVVVVVVVCVCVCVCARARALHASVGSSRCVARGSWWGAWGRAVVVLSYPCCFPVKRVLLDPRDLSEQAAHGVGDELQRKRGQSRGCTGRAGTTTRTHTRARRTQSSDDDDRQQRLSEISRKQKSLEQPPQPQQAHHSSPLRVISRNGLHLWCQSPAWQGRARHANRVSVSVLWL
jgi:hypothetical protein